MFTISGMFGSPTARRLILRAASRYRSMVAGETNSRSARLSKPLAELSAGSSSVKSISLGRFSRARRSRIALLYSVRVRRCRFGRSPGFGFGGGSAIEFGFEVRRHSLHTAAAIGRGSPGGGIDCARSWRTDFFPHFGVLATWPSAAGSSTTPPVFSARCGKWRNTGET